MERRAARPHDGDARSRHETTGAHRSGARTRIRHAEANVAARADRFRCTADARRAGEPEGRRRDGLRGDPWPGDPERPQRSDSRHRAPTNIHGSRRSVEPILRLPRRRTGLGTRLPGESGAARPPRRPAAPPAARALAEAARAERRRTLRLGLASDRTGHVGDLRGVDAVGGRHRLLPEPVPAEPAESIESRGGQHRLHEPGTPDRGRLARRARHRRDRVQRHGGEPVARLAKG